MKPLSLLITLIAFSVFAKAQKIHFADTTNVWEVVRPQYNAPSPWTFNYSTYGFTGKASIDTVEYIKFGFGWVREDTVFNKVYLRSGDSDLVLMDYNLGVGDTFFAPFYKFPVIGIDSTLINSVWHKVWQFPFPPGGWYSSTSIVSVIEGIGCIEGPTFMIGNYTGCVECGQPFMYCFSNNGSRPVVDPKVEWLNNTSSCTYYATLDVDQLSLSHSEPTIYPSPSANEITISSTDKISTIELRNYLGQIILTREVNAKQVQIDVSDLSAGMYVVRINNTYVRKLVKQ
jgi:hypothetical protein